MKKQSIYKVVVLGEGIPVKHTGQVGKTSITLKYVNDVFNEHLPRTVNASYLEKEVTLGDNSKAKLAIWVSCVLFQDTAGQEMYNAMAPIYYKDASAAIVVYDITSIDSFEKVRKWIRELRESSNERILIAIVGNKMDLESMRKVKKNMAESFANEAKIAHFEVSARNGKNISKVFEYLAEEINKYEHKDQDVNVRGKRDRKRLEISDDRNKNQSNKSKCCS